MNGIWKKILIRVSVPVLVIIILFIPKTIIWSQKVNNELKNLTEVDKKLAQADVNLSETLRETNKQIEENVNEKLKFIKEARNRELDQIYKMIQNIDTYIKTIKE